MASIDGKSSGSLSNSASGSVVARSIRRGLGNPRRLLFCESGRAALGVTAFLDLFDDLSAESFEITGLRDVRSGFGTMGVCIAIFGAERMPNLDYIRAEIERMRVQV